MCPEEQHLTDWWKRAQLSRGPAAWFAAVRKLSWYNQRYELHSMYRKWYSTMMTCHSQFPTLCFDTLKSVMGKIPISLAWGYCYLWFFFFAFICFSWSSEKRQPFPLLLVASSHCLSLLCKHTSIVLSSSSKVWYPCSWDSHSSSFECLEMILMPWFLSSFNCPPNILLITLQS